MFNNTVSKGADCVCVSVACWVFYITEAFGWKDGRQRFGEAFLNSLTHIVSGIMERLVLDWRGDCAHTDTDNSLSRMQSYSVRSSL